MVSSNWNEIGDTNAGKFARQKGMDCAESIKVLLKGIGYTKQSAIKHELSKPIFRADLDPQYDVSHFESWIIKRANIQCRTVRRRDANRPGQSPPRPDNMVAADCVCTVATVSLFGASELHASMEGIDGSIQKECREQSDQAPNVAAAHE